MRLTGGQVFDPQTGFSVKDVCLEGGKIVENCQDSGVDVSGCYVIPGLTDVHFHGCVGADVSDADPKGLAEMAAYELSRGVTQICPAGMTLAAEQLEKVCTMVAQHRANQVPGAELVGIHLEGPFLSEAKKGAQNGAWLRKPDVALLRRLDECAQGMVKLVSVAPELEGAMDFIREVKDEVSVSLAHTTANYDIAMAAFEAGANHVTHLYNAMPSLLHRAPGVIGAACEKPGVTVELIADGLHSHPAAARLAYAAFGPARLCLISDSLSCCGCENGVYYLGGQQVFLDGNLARLADGTIAGSANHLFGILQNAVAMGFALADAVRMATWNPATVLGVQDQVGAIAPGLTADFLVCSPALELEQVYLAGAALEA